MKIVLLMCIVASCYAFPTPDEWEDYKIKFNKSYPDAAEEQARKDIFLKNKDFVDKHNKKYEEGLIGYNVRLNIFSDRTEEEMEDLYDFIRQIQNERKVSETA